MKSLRKRERDFVSSLASWVAGLRTLIVGEASCVEQCGGVEALSGKFKKK